VELLNHDEGESDGWIMSTEDEWDVDMEEEPDLYLGDSSSSKPIPSSQERPQRLGS